MSAYTSRFAPITEFLQEFLRGLPRCCSELYQWVRRLGKPEVPVEFDLNEFAQQFGYSVDWATRCLKRLFDEGLLTKDRQAWGKWFRVVLHDPDFSPGGSKQSPSRPNKTPKKQPSNPQGSVPDPKGAKPQSEGSELEPEGRKDDRHVSQSRDIVSRKLESIGTDLSCGTGAATVENFDAAAYAKEVWRRTQWR